MALYQSHDLYHKELYYELVNIGICKERLLPRQHIHPILPRFKTGTEFTEVRVDLILEGIFLYAIIALNHYVLLFK